MPEHFTTYAQNAEDVMLWRALKHVERGFYIDVGAQDPVVDSVTKAFYERGWHGINIEPVQHWYKRLVGDRPHDVNLRVATSNQPGELTLFEVEDTGLSTCNPEFARRHREQGRNVREVVVPCRTLDDICTEYDVGAVHFLKVDCEGAEKQTIEGMSFASVRPWIVLVEATEPNSTAPTHHEWEHLLVERGYEFAYFDGLNRFYLASEHAALRDAFSVPANVLDWASRYVDVRAHEQINSLKDELAKLGSVARGARFEAECDLLRMENERLGTELERLRQEQQVGQEALHARDVQVETLTASADELRKEKERLGTELERLRQEQQVGQQALHARDVQVEALSASADALRKENHRLAGELERASGDLQSALDSLELRDAQIATFAVGLGRVRMMCKEISAMGAEQESGDVASPGVDLHVLMEQIRKDVYGNSQSREQGEEIPATQSSSGYADGRDALSTDELMDRVHSEVAKRRGLLATANGEDKESEKQVARAASRLRWRPAAPRLEPRSEYHLGDLLQFDDEDFIETTYQTLLHRAPDADGREHYLTLLREGRVSKVEVLGSIRFSEEGRKCGVHVDGLLLPYKLHQWRHRRVIGPILGFAMGMLRMPRLARHLQAMEARASRESQEIGRLFNRLEEEVTRRFGDSDEAIDALRTQSAQSSLKQIEAVNALGAWIETLQKIVEAQGKHQRAVESEWHQYRRELLDKLGDQG